MSSVICVPQRSSVRPAKPTPAKGLKRRIVQLHQQPHLLERVAIHRDGDRYLISLSAPYLGRARKAAQDSVVVKLFKKGTLEITNPLIPSIRHHASIRPTISPAKAARNADTKKKFRRNMHHIEATMENRLRGLLDICRGSFISSVELVITPELKKDDFPLKELERAMRSFLAREGIHLEGIQKPSSRQK